MEAELEKEIILRKDTPQRPAPDCCEPDVVSAKVNDARSPLARGDVLWAHACLASMRSRLTLQNPLLNSLGVRVCAS